MKTGTGPAVRLRRTHAVKLFPMFTENRSRSLRFICHRGKTPGPWRAHRHLPRPSVPGRHRGDFAYRIVPNLPIALLIYRS
jgi:hypothetical protein